MLTEKLFVGTLQEWERKDLRGLYGYIPTAINGMAASLRLSLTQRVDHRHNRDSRLMLFRRRKTAANHLRCDKGTHAIMHGDPGPVHRLTATGLLGAYPIQPLLHGMETGSSAIHHGMGRFATNLPTEHRPIGLMING